MFLSVSLTTTAVLSQSSDDSSLLPWAGLNSSLNSAQHSSFLNLHHSVIISAFNCFLFWCPNSSYRLPSNTAQFHSPLKPLSRFLSLSDYTFNMFACSILMPPSSRPTTISAFTFLSLTQNLWPTFNLHIHWTLLQSPLSTTSSNLIQDSLFFSNWHPTCWTYELKTFNIARSKDPKPAFLDFFLILLPYICLWLYIWLVWMYKPLSTLFTFTCIILLKL